MNLQNPNRVNPIWTMTTRLPVMKILLHFMQLLTKFTLVAVRIYLNFNLDQFESGGPVCYIEYSMELVKSSVVNFRNAK